MQDNSQHRRRRRTFGAARGRSEHAEQAPQLTRRKVVQVVQAVAQGGAVLSKQRRAAGSGSAPGAAAGQARVLLSGPSGAGGVGSGGGGGQGGAGEQLQG